MERSKDGDKRDQVGGAGSCPERKMSVWYKRTALVPALVPSAQRLQEVQP